MIMVKILIEQSISDTPKEVVTGEREKLLLVEKYKSIKMQGDDYKPEDVTKNMAKAKNELAAEGLINKIGLSLVEQTQAKLDGTKTDREAFNEKLKKMKEKMAKRKASALPDINRKKSRKGAKDLQEII